MVNMVGTDVFLSFGAKNVDGAQDYFLITV